MALFDTTAKKTYWGIALLLVLGLGAYLIYHYAWQKKPASSMLAAPRGGIGSLASVPPPALVSAPAATPAMVSTPAPLLIPAATPAPSLASSAAASAAAARGTQALLVPPTPPAADFGVVTAAMGADSGRGSSTTTFPSMTHAAQASRSQSAPLLGGDRPAAGRRKQRRGASLLHVHDKASGMSDDFFGSSSNGNTYTVSDTDSDSDSADGGDEDDDMAFQGGPDDYDGTGSMADTLGGSAATSARANPWGPLPWKEAPMVVSASAKTTAARQPSSSHAAGEKNAAGSIPLGQATTAKTVSSAKKEFDQEKVFQELSQGQRAQKKILGGDAHQIFDNYWTKFRTLYKVGTGGDRSFSVPHIRFVNGHLEGLGAMPTELSNFLEFCVTYRGPDGSANTVMEDMFPDAQMEDMDKNLTLLLMCAYNPKKHPSLCCSGKWFCEESTTMNLMHPDFKPFLSR